MRPKKAFGQHFLHRQDIAQRIADALKQSHAYDDIVEVGPGQGVLTQYLIPSPKRLLAIEVDRDMVNYLGEHYPQLNVINKDFLKADLHALVGRPFALIGNFPYNISSQILIKMVETRELIPEMVGMFQKEVAERVVAEPGSKVYGVISVLVQAFYDGEYLFKVGKGAFNPPPKVESAVIRLTRKADPDESYEYRTFRSIVKITFGQRRKMLRNTLKSFFVGEYEEELQDEFYRQRPENLSVADFIALAKRVEAIKATQQDEEA